MSQLRTARLRGVLFDVDGTLLDSNDAHAASWVDVLIEFGYAVPFREVRPLVGMGSDKLIPSLIGLERAESDGEKIAERKNGIFEERYLAHLKPTPGARALLKRFLAEGLVLVVATSAGEEEMKGLLRQAGIEDLVHETTSSGEVDNSKPDPDVIGAAIKKSKLKPSELVMLGDTPYDIEAAAKADIATIALRCGGWWDDDALAGAIAIFEDPADLLGNWPLTTPTSPRRVRGDYEQRTTA
jgi:HAD superfamily hydrolase (TIGR01509 family)